MIQSAGYAANHSFTGLKLHKFERQEPQPNEVLIDILYCGVCHSDIHQVKNDWGNTIYPCMPGHEIVGRVAAVGNAVTLHKVGDTVGVGCMIDSCRHCEPCHAGEENYCEGPNSWLATYNGPVITAEKATTHDNQYGRENTYGGYSNNIVVAEDFVLKIPASLPVEKVAPILCAGVTTYSPLRHWEVKPGAKVGILGFGGLGDMAIKLAVAMGAQVFVFTETEEKLDEAARLGATAIFAENYEGFEAHKNSFDFLLSTIPEATDLNPYIPLLKRDCSLVIVGALGELKPFNNQAIAFHRRSVGGSIIGGIRETQEVLDFCAEHNITPDVELIPIQQINDAFTRVNDGDVRFRYVIDMASLQSDLN